MSAKATKRSHKTDDKRDAARDKKPELKQAAAPEAVHHAAPEGMPADSQPATDPQLAGYRRQLEELGQHLKALEGALGERVRKEAALQQQLADSRTEATTLRTELQALRERYRCVGRGALIVANGFDAAKRTLPSKLSSLRQAVQRFR